MTSTATHVLAPRLTAALDLVSVRADGLQATVAGSEFTAESPRDLRGRLSNALYEEFHAGNGEHRREPGGVPRLSLRDASLEERLAAGVPHAWTPARARLIEVLHREGGDQLVVQLPDITARVPADRLIGTGDGNGSGNAPQPGDIVELALEAARPALSPGFFYVMGSRALPRPAGPIRRLFVHALDGSARKPTQPQVNDLGFASCPPASRGPGAGGSRVARQSRCGGGTTKTTASKRGLIRGSAWVSNHPPSRTRRSSLIRRHRGQYGRLPRQRPRCGCG
ncbi:hypothetical protein [Streptomyces sp. NPDC090445]|uniref:hypothetical protein n=1 Tax=Streptomyces sp. NPDC090445 TaxID=3365963 RepID=UPI003806DCA2